MMVLAEILLVLLAIFLFLITDSRVINFATEDILHEYNISYQKISGNLFTGIKVDRPRYENQLLLDQAIVHWNPFSLKREKIHITQLELRGLRPTAIMKIISSFEDSKQSSTPKLKLGILIDKITLTSKPLTFAGVTFKDFHLGTTQLEIDKNLNVRSKLFNISVNSKLTDMQIRGKLEKNILSLDKIQLLEIDPKVISSFMQEIEKSNTTSSNKKNKTSIKSFPIKKIKIKNLFATMKSTTYDSISIDNTRVLINDIDIDPHNNFNYNAKEVTLSLDTSFASSLQKGFIKDSELFTQGEVTTNEYLFSKYNLPLNQQELYILPVSLKLNHSSLWLDIEHSVENLLVLESDFNIDLDHAKHIVDYRYQDDFISITSEINGSTTYTNGVNIKNIVDINFRDESAEVIYYGDATVKSITNISPFLIDTLLRNPTLTYHGGVDELLVNIDSDQISGSFLSQGYSDAKIKLETKHDVLLSSLIPALPPELQMAQGGIKSQSKIYFNNIKNSYFHIDLDSNLANISADMDLIEPYHISYNATIPTHSLLYNIDQKINFANLQEINGKVIIGETLHHIEINNQELQLNFDYDVENRVFSSGALFINGESIFFKGSLEDKLHVKLDIQDINSLSNTLIRYYNIELPPLSGSANISIKRLADSSIDIYINSPYISYENINGDINAKVRIDAYQNTNITLKSAQLFYENVSGDISANIDIDTHKNIDISLNSSQLSYRDFSGEMSAKVKIDSHKNMEINLHSSQLSHKNFMGDLSADINIDEEKNIYIMLNSHKISLLKEGEVTDEIYKLSTNFSIYHEDITIDNYSFHIRNNPYIRHIFSNQPAYLTYKNDTIYTKELWLNEQIEVSGHYHIPTQKGKLKLYSDYFPYKDKDFDLLTTFKLALQLDKEKIFVSGNIKLLGDKINYKLTDSKFSEDSDIIIIQEQREKEASVLNNIKLYLTIENDTPIKYITKDINIDLTNEITVVKGYNKDIRLLGKTKIVQGYYMQEDKKFFLDESHIYFYGEPKDSILEIRANYIKDKYNIQIFISGSSSDPIINFTSTPYLTQREILSLILFDTTASNSGAGTAVYAMLGGTFAKELMKNLGISVDHLLLGEGIDERLSLEVGKKISDNMTFILQHKNGKDGLKVKIDHNLNFETDIIIQPSASSIEFLYKSD